MDFAKLSSPSLKELFIKELESLILSGKLETGTRLPTERELARSMQVSRGVVNAGLSELARKGFLHVKPRSGVFVADYRRYGTAETLLSIMNYNGGRLRRAEIRSLLEMKVIMDKLAVALAASVLSAGDLEALGAKLATLEAPATPEAAAEAAFSFYHELALVSGNMLLPLIYRSFHAPVIHLWIRYVRKYGQEAVRQNAAALLAALKAGDVPAASAAVDRAVLGVISGGKEIYDD